MRSNEGSIRMTQFTAGDPSKFKEFIEAIDSDNIPLGKSIEAEFTFWTGIIFDKEGLKVEVLCYEITIRIFRDGKTWNTQKMKGLKSLT